MEQKNSRTLKPRVIRKIEIYLDPAADDEDYFQSNDKENIQFINDGVKKILDYSANSTEYHPTGPLVITPHYLKSIPNEIVSLIMDYLAEQQSSQLKQKDLYQCALVNKQFYRTVNSMLWHRPTISNANTLEQLTNSLASAQMDKVSFDILGNHLQRLNIQGPYWNDVDFSFMLPFIRLLRTLIISDNAKNITCASLKRLPQCCPHLTHLYLVHTPITDKFIDAIRQHCYQLLQIGVTTKNLPIDIFKKLAKCPLKIIFLYCSRKTEGMFFNSHSSYDNIIHDMKTFDQLNNLSIKGPGAEQLTNTIFSMTDTMTWPQLAKLQIAGENDITDTVFTSFIKSHCHLKHLDLQIQLSDSALHAIATHLPQLTHLLLHDNYTITKSGVYHLVRHCNHLKQADFLNCYPAVTAMTEFYDPKSNSVTLDVGKMQKIRQAD